MSQRKTRKVVNNPNEAHSLTFSCFQRQQFLSRDGSRTWLIEAIDRARTKYPFHVWAYVIMPEHVHLLIWPTQIEYDVSEIYGSIKLSVTKRALAHVRSTAPAFLTKMADKQPNGKVHYRFWQRGGGFDLNIADPRVIHRQIEYIHNNPVRRGLCNVAEDWYWSSAADYARIRSGPLRIDFDSLPPFVLSAYGPLI